MCAHYKYRAGRIGELVSTSGGWASPSAEVRAVVEYLNDLKAKKDVESSNRDTTGHFIPPSTSSADLAPTGKPPPRDDGQELLYEVPPDQTEVFQNKQTTEILVQKNGGIAMVESIYGLVPPFISRRTGKPMRHRNCRDDSLNFLNPETNRYETKISFADPFRRRRAIAALSTICEAVGRGEWLEISHVLPDQDFYVAAMYNPPNEYSPNNTHCIITTAANEVIDPYFDRFPAILAYEDFEEWLDPKTTRERLLQMIQPCPSSWVGEMWVRTKHGTKVPPWPRQRDEDDDQPKQFGFEGM